MGSEPAISRAIRIGGTAASASVAAMPRTSMKSFIFTSGTGCRASESIDPVFSLPLGARSKSSPGLAPDAGEMNLK
jgi:hypothetical protein